jgi:hypothetical protein
MSNITFRNEVGPGVEILRISKEGIWANPDVPVDQAAHAVLAAVESNIKELVKKAVEAEREGCAQLCESYGPARVLSGEDCAAAIRARGKA